MTLGAMIRTIGVADGIGRGTIRAMIRGSTAPLGMDIGDITVGISALRGIIRYIPDP